jgi:kynureninase
VDIFTPADPAQRGCQLSLSFRCCTPTDAVGGLISSSSSSSEVVTIDTILEALKEEGVLCDARKPNVIRIAPAPLYNSFRDVCVFVTILKGVLATK